MELNKTFKEIYEILSEVDINLPLLEVMVPLTEDEVLSEVDINLPLFEVMVPLAAEVDVFETMTSLGEMAEFDFFESMKYPIENFKCFSIQDENLEDEPCLASGYFRKSTHLELDDIPTPLVEHDSPRIEDMVTKLKEDHQVVVGMNLELTTKLDEVIKEKNDLREEFEQRMKLMGEEILSRDKALEIMRTKEKEHLAKLAMPKIDTKGKSKEVIQQPQVLDMQAKHKELKPLASMPIPS